MNSGRADCQPSVLCFVGKLRGDSEGGLIYVFTTQPMVWLRGTNAETVSCKRHPADVCVNRKMMEVCGEAENRLASELMHHELQIEKDVLDPLSQLAEVRELH